MQKKSDIDPKGLIAEAYAMEGISPSECRSIFLDWALSLPMDADTQSAIDHLLARHGQASHPMTQVLEAGRAQMATPRRRGGWRSRNRPN